MRANWLRVRTWLPGVVVSGLAILLILRVANWEDLSKAVAQMDWRYLIVAIILFFISLLARVFAWWVLLQRKASYKKSFYILNIGYLLNNLFPFRLGELGRAVLMGEASQTTPFFVLSTIMIERLIDVALAAVLLLATLPFVFDLTWARSLGLAALLLVFVGLIFLFILAQSRSRWRPWLAKKLERWPRFSHTILPWLDSLLDGFGILANPGQLLLAIVLMCLSWVLAVAEYYLLLIAIYPLAEFWWAGFMLSVAAFGVALPSAPGSLGVFEASIVGALALLGVSSSAALAVAVIAHLIHYLVTVGFGLVGFYQEGTTIGAIYHRVTRFRSKTIINPEAR